MHAAATAEADDCCGCDRIGRLADDASIGSRSGHRELRRGQRPPQHSLSLRRRLGPLRLAARRDRRPWQHQRCRPHPDDRRDRPQGCVLPQCACQRPLLHALPQRPLNRPALLADRHRLHPAGSRLERLAAELSRGPAGCRLRGRLLAQGLGPRPTFQLALHKRRSLQPSRWPRQSVLAGGHQDGRRWHRPRAGQSGDPPRGSRQLPRHARFTARSRAILLLVWPDQRAPHMDQGQRQSPLGHQPG